MFYNFFIPGGIGGDAYKIYLLHKKFGWSAKTLTSALFNDRLSGLLAICVLILLFSATLFEMQWSVLFLFAATAGILLTFFITKRFFSTFQPVFFKGFSVSVLIQILQILCFVFLLKSLGIAGHYIIYSIVFLASSVLLPWVSITRAVTSTDSGMLPEVPNGNGVASAGRRSTTPAGTV